MFWKRFNQLYMLYLFLLVCHSHSKTIASNGAPGDNCMMGGGVMGKCEEIESCLRDGGVAQRAGQVTVCLNQQPKIYVCCRRPDLIAEELCATWANYWRGDGQVCIKDTPLIIGGVNAELGEFPHIAVVGYRGESGTIIWGCGGTLISPHYVMTAAHCVRRELLKYFVQLGEHDRTFKSEEKLPRVKGHIPSILYQAEALKKDTTQEVLVKQFFEVVEVKLHPEYEAFPKYNDIALLKLNRPATLTRRVLPACLHTNIHDDLFNRSFVVAGWGRTNTGFAELTDILMKVKVPVTDKMKCQVIIARDDRFSVPNGVLEDQICAGKQGKDSCTGDSGGPMIYQEERNGSACEYTVMGIVSFGYGCGNFGIYVRVDHYLDWIMGYIAPNASS